MRQEMDYRLPETPIDKATKLKSFIQWLCSYRVELQCKEWGGIKQNPKHLMSDSVRAPVCTPCAVETPYAAKENP